MVSDRRPRLQLNRPRSTLRRWRPWGRWAIPTAADPQRPRIMLNRYPHEVIGVAVFFGGRRYLSWVWPIRIVGLRLTDDQFDRGVREITGEAPDV